MPRYSFAIIILGLILGLFIIDQFSKKSRVLQLVFQFLIVCLSVPGVLLSYNYINNGFSLVLQLNRYQLPLGFSSAFATKTNAYQYLMSLDIINFIRKLAANDLLVWNARVEPALLWNTAYSNKVKFLPVTNYDLWPDGSVSSSYKATLIELELWNKKIRALDPNYILLATDSAYSHYLNSLSDFPYILVLSDNNKNNSLSIWQKK